MRQHAERRGGRAVLVSALVVAILLGAPEDAHAYIDPG